MLLSRAEQSRAERIDWIDFGKGLTVLMVVFGHVVLGLFESNRFESSETALLFIVQVFYLFHIPVFFALSGFFFKPILDLKCYFKYMKYKTIALGIPYIFYSIVQFILQSIGGSTVRNPASFSELLGIFHTPLGVSWYLYVLWWIYATLGVLTLWIKNHNYLLTVTIIAYGVSMIVPVKIYIVQKLLLWSFFFILGYWLRKSELTKFLEKHWKLIVSSTVLVIAIFMLFWELSKPDFYISYDTPGLLGLIFPISVFLAFASYPIMNRINKFGSYFRRHGKDSIIIYLLHAPIVSVARIFLLKLGIGNVFLHICIGLCAGWFGSTLVIYLTSKIPYSDFVFYPVKYLKK